MFHLIREQIKEGEAELSISAGVDPAADRFKCGYIKGLRDVLDIDIQFQEEEKNDRSSRL